ncbi:hypothetical protein GLOTRDRAFT_96265 [Gloeophyllum trabeum ATCC 11539]|uniref:F-box domain-containing protein n=1 Tax=Gloeophyllum trabeum (strain ATCC 11539 / FP-39264 / Madison 617) TaxID=670483 RepID=S7PV73_GLOTA|nr:uncharacterized protein GLOTRDRAFT_96265 [Gloeophyllum trabeum ATCC 11539]EPQ51511.1 hypothetical protein GLOTRDRAFT_96265 [Gloeophyllum trabeum ATCC 11539]
MIRDKKSVILVCKAWREVATPLLYTNVSLRRIAQVPLFLRTLRTQGAFDFPGMVKSLCIECAISDKHLSALEATSRVILGDIEKDSSVPKDFEGRDVVLPHLANFCMRLECTGPGAYIKHIATPVLTSMTIIAAVCVADSSSIGAICIPRGPNLKFLCIGGRLKVDVNAIIEACPVLEHLVVNDYSPLPRRHSHLLFLDVWCRSRQCTREARTWVWSYRGHLFPALQRFRLLDCPLQNIPNLIDALPPSRHTEDRVRVHLPGATVWDRAEGLFEEVPSHYPPGPSGYELLVDHIGDTDFFSDWDDESYEPSSTPSSPSTSSSCSWASEDSSTGSCVSKDLSQSEYEQLLEFADSSDQPSGRPG